MLFWNYFNDDVACDKTMTQSRRQNNFINRQIIALDCEFNGSTMPELIEFISILGRWVGKVEITWSEMVSVSE